MKLKRFFIFLWFTCKCTQSQAQFSFGISSGLSGLYYSETSKTVRIDRIIINDSISLAPISLSRPNLRKASLSPNLRCYFSLSAGKRMDFSAGLEYFSVETSEQMFDIYGAGMGSVLFTRRYLGGNLMANFCFLDENPLKIKAGIGVLPSLQYYGGPGVIFTNGPDLYSGFPETYRFDAANKRFLLAGVMTAGIELRLTERWIFTFDYRCSASLFKSENLPDYKGSEIWKSISFPDNWRYISVGMVPGIKYQFKNSN